MTESNGKKTLANTHIPTENVLFSSQHHQQKCNVFCTTILRVSRSSDLSFPHHCLQQTKLNSRGFPIFVILIFKGQPEVWPKIRMCVKFCVQSQHIARSPNTTQGHYTRFSGRHLAMWLNINKQTQNLIKIHIFGQTQGWPIKLETLKLPVCHKSLYIISTASSENVGNCVTQSFGKRLKSK